MIKKLILYVVLIIVVILGLSIFLSTDSLSGCGSSPSQVRGCEAADAIVAVSGGDTKARTQEAINLYQKGWGKKIIFSGAAADKSGPSNARAMRTQAINQGVPKRDIIIEEKSETTHQNAEKTNLVFAKNNIKSAIIVTSGYHQKRTLLEFSAHSPNIKFRSHPPASDNQWSVWWWISPYGWYLVASELLKIIIFYAGAAS
ncbi:hypothetical protein CR956_00445 [Candidatus Saccharibacteria bacterium]|nr:MAG: hypothetical protein CR956_00445 [Candidatus Saccharibacteria bacterium]